MSRLKEIEERCEKAAPEPWCSHDPGMYCGYACTPDGCYENHDSPVRQLEGPATEWPEPNGGPVDDGTLQCFTIADADFIAHARTDVPALLRLVALRERQLRIVLFDHRRLSYDSQPDKIMSMFDAAALAALEGE